MSDNANPYAAPQAPVADVDSETGTQPVRIWPPDGRMGRLRYVAYGSGGWLALVILMGVAGGLSAAAQSPSLMVVATVLGYVAFFAFTVLLTVQRCHDINWTGWLAALSLVPLANLLFLFVPGSPGANRYGAPPPPNTGFIKTVAVVALLIIPVGIVAAIALPAYQQYVVRAKAAQGR